MGKQLSLLFALVLASGCAASHEGLCDERLHATVTIEETGEVLAVRDVGTGMSTRFPSGEQTDHISVWLESGETMFITFARPAVIGRPIPLGTDIPDARVTIVAVGLCGGSPMSEGELILDYVQLDQGDPTVEPQFVNCIGGSLRVRFADCAEELFGRSASETTLLVELGRR